MFEYFKNLIVWLFDNAPQISAVVGLIIGSRYLFKKYAMRIRKFKIIDGKIQGDKKVFFHSREVGAVELRCSLFRNSPDLNAVVIVRCGLIHDYFYISLKKCPSNTVPLEIQWEVLEPRYSAVGRDAIELNSKNWNNKHIVPFV